VRFHFAPLNVDEVAQLALHRFEGVVDHFVEGIVRAIVFLLLVGNKLVTARNGHVNANTVLISFVMGVVRLFDRDVAAINVIAEFFQPRGFVQYEIVDLVGFFQTPITDLNRQLHD
jgi:hypothetical protein